MIKTVQQKRRLKFITLCYLSLAINIFMYFFLSAKGNKTELTPKTLILVLIFAIGSGLGQVYTAIVRKDFTVFRTFLGLVFISLVLVIEAYKNISVFTAVLLFCCVSIQSIALIIYIKSKPKQKNS